MTNRLLALCLCACLTPAGAAAANIGVFPVGDAAGLPSATGRAVKFSGPIDDGDHSQFLASVASVRPDLVVLNSPGGSIAEALRIAERIRSAGLGTFVRAGQECSSACMVLFLSGQSKSAEPGALLGLHAARHYDNDSVSVTGTAAMAAVLGQLGVPIEVVVQMADTAPGQMWYLGEEKWAALDIDVLTPPAPDMDVLTQPRLDEAVLKPPARGTPSLKPGAVPMTPVGTLPIPGL
ncbi:MAG TPA: hypothetical protein VHG92_06955 [Afifellaceae bacterium]|nr:hypothetical protein [Afifellaceae bacterium]